MQSLTAAIKLSPDFVVAYANRASVYSETGQAAKGMADVEKGLAIDPENEEVLTAKAYCLVELGRKKKHRKFVKN
ncbi:MAG: tetratricopeptide repeat protein [Chitinophagaceae bacterium]|nr:tetratricopeptide repeat protein [Chitinophagaceae bacterium]